MCKCSSGSSGDAESWTVSGSADRDELQQMEARALAAESDAARLRAAVQLFLSGAGPAEGGKIFFHKDVDELNAVLRRVRPPYRWRMVPATKGTE